MDTDQELPFLNLCESVPRLWPKRIFLLRRNVKNRVVAESPSSIPRGIFAEIVNAFPAVLGPRFWPRIRLVLALILVFSVTRSIIADWSTVPSGSMTPTLIEGDRVLVNKLAYDLKIPFTTRHLLQWSDPRRGDVIVCFEPGTGLRLVKRVIGIPGDTIELRDNILVLNHVPAQYSAASVEQGGHIALVESPAKSGLPHSILETPTLRAIRSFAPVTVPAGKYFLMGDNRDDSLDSRYFGFVDRSQIIGRASRVLFSLGDYCVPRIGRCFESVR